MVKRCIYGHRAQFVWTDPDEEKFKEQRAYYFHAARTGNIELMRSLYKENPSMATSRNENNETIWLPAVRHADKNTVQYIVEFLKFHSILNVNETDHKGRNCFHLAAQGGKLETLKYLNSNFPELRNSRDNEGKTALDLAKEEKQKEVVFFLETTITPISISHCRDLHKVCTILAAEYFNHFIKKCSTSEKFNNLCCSTCNEQRAGLV